MVSASRRAFATFSFSFSDSSAASCVARLTHTPLHALAHISIHIATTKSGLIEKHLLRMLRTALLAWGEDKGCYIIQGTFKWYTRGWFYSALISSCFDLSLSCVFFCCLCQSDSFPFLVLSGTCHVASCPILVFKCLNLQLSCNKTMFLYFCQNPISTKTQWKCQAAEKPWSMNYCIIAEPNSWASACGSSSWCSHNPNRETDHLY